MDIVLRTNNRDPSFELRDVERYSKHSGFCAIVAVRVRGFSGELRVCVEPEPFLEFVEALEAMDRTLAGSARLKPAYEDPFVDFVLSRTGTLYVSGELVHYAPATQRLQFEFETDQTVLGPFAQELRACMNAGAR